MTHYLFASWDGGGNVPPALGIAAELSSRGHRVRFVGHERQRTQISEAGFAFKAYASALPFTCLEVNPPERMVEIFNDAGIGADVVADALQQPTDVVVVDCMLLAAQAAVRSAGLVHVPLEHLFDEYLRQRWLRGPFGQVAEARGYAPYATLDAAPLNLVASLPELDPAARGPRPDNLVYCGPVVELPARRELASLPPMVLVSLSTYNFPGQTEAMQRILDALAGLDARVVVTTGPVIDGSSLRIPENVTVHDYVDHVKLMPEATLVIGHGGHATTMRALAHDLPLLVLPMHPMLDQSMVGEAIEEAGAGRLLAKEAPPEEIRSAVEVLLPDGPHRAAAARLGDAVRSHAGATGAADALEGLVRGEASAPGLHAARR
jgi:UDP:flavonoid glycosyltransferase YjiC (YdhE family)